MFAIVWLVLELNAGLTFGQVKHLYWGGTIGLGTFHLVGAVASWQYRGVWKGRETLSVLLGAAALATYVWATHVEPYRLQIREQTVPATTVEEPIRIVHLSDIQTPSIGAYERRVFERVREQDPDLVVHTGDVLQPPTESGMEAIAELFQTLDPPLGIYNVEGDADGALSDERWAWFDELAGTETLLNETTSIEARGTTIELMGLRTRRSRMLQPEQIQNWLESADPDDRHLHVVMGHAPDYMLEVRGTDLDLALAGHTHGGQIRIPFYGPPVTLSRVPRHWARGLTAIEDTHLNVSAGIGAERSHGIPPIRINCPPEFSVIEVVPKGQ
jgi:predicted MPP superfamily phosphohydrolase